MAADDDDEKTEEPTQRRLDDARQKGDIIYSTEVAGAFSLLATTIFVAFFAGPIASDIAHGFLGFIASPEQFSTDPGALRRLALEIFLKIAGILGGAMLAFSLAGVAARYVQDQPTFTGEKLSPKLDKVNPIEGMKRVFGKQAFAQFVKSLAKFAIVGAALVWALWPHDASLSNLSLLDPMAILPYVKDKAVAMMVALAGATLVIAIIDYVTTRQSYMHKLKMSRRELKEEMRQSEGDPMVKMKLRQIRQERSRKRMMQSVPEASVIITNPTHYAIALKYVQGETPAPICLAKGVDAVALRIREIAGEHDIPIIEDPPLARALFATADIDEPIPREHFEAVAKIIGVVMRLAAQRRRLRVPPNRRL
ncbi:MAG: flagellar biosynthesis protein FlhB [Caulobacterales bacterium]